MRTELNFGPGDLDDMAGRGTMAVLCREVLADLFTPVGAFLRTAAGEPHAFLLESVAGGESVARYSFLGASPRRLFRIRQGRPTLEDAGGTEQPLAGEPLEALRRLWRQRRPVPLPGLPPLASGFVGFFSYDLVRSLERLAERSQDDLAIPDAVLGEYDSLLAFDHRHNRLLLLAAVNLEGEAAARRRSYEDACSQLQALQTRLATPAPLGEEGIHGTSLGPVLATPSERQFLEQVQSAQRHITAGDIFQVVLSRRFSRPWSGSPLSVYRMLRTLNPSPYHFFLACNGDYLAGASPEMLVRVEGGRLAVRPIAGTRPRGKDAAEDNRWEGDLRADEKEMAEHVMLVDLARNDVGRVSQAGTVRVDSFAEVERFSHVMHLVSTVGGELLPDRDALHAFAACFPAGTLTGAPKVRAMEIIEAAEPSRRGPYGGAVAYLDHGGHLDSCITIRTVVMSGGQAHVQAGAGIVADSSADGEKQEIDHKARAMMEALARGGEIR